MTQLSRFSVQRRMARKKRVPRVPMLIPDNYEIDTSLMNFGQPGSLIPLRRIRMKPGVFTRIGLGWGRK